MNTIYLASAASMLLGCYLLSGAGSAEGGGLVHVLSILGWLTGYELLLVGLAGFLGRRGLQSDSRTLMMLAAVFVADVTHLSAEAVASSGSAWMFTAFALLVLAAAKLALVLWVFKVRPSFLDLLPTAFLLALLLALPGLFSELAQRGLALDLPLYGASWVIGLVFVLRALHPPPAAAAKPAIAAFTRVLHTALPLSIAAHVLALHWLYEVALRACSVTASLLALGFVLTRAADALDALGRRVLLPAAAILFSTAWPASFAFGETVTFSPLRAALVGAGVLYLYDFRRHRQAAFAVLASACAGVATAGPTFTAAYQNVAALGDRQAHRFSHLVPRTRQHWGAVAMALAYGLLALGAWVSYKRRGGPRGAASGRTLRL